MTQTYDGLFVPREIRADRILSAFDNEMDESSLDYYRNEVDMFQVDAISGYPSVIDEDDIGKVFLCGEEVEDSHLGEAVWYVTDGHHRSVIAGEMGISLPVKIDYSCITTEEDLERYNLIQKGENPEKDNNTQKPEEKSENRKKSKNNRPRLS